MSSQSANRSAPAGSFNDPTSPIQYTLNSRIMIAAVVVLFVVVFFIFTLHIYAKWFWRRRGRRTASWRRRNRLQFTGEEPLNIDNRTSLGLDIAVINALPIFVYQLSKDEEATILECAVCLCEFEQGEKGRLLPDCKHSFHTECIDMWFHSHMTCPLCRTVVSMETPSSNTADTSMQGSMSPMPLLRNASDSHHSRHASDAVRAPASDGMFLSPAFYPSNILFWGDHNHVSSQLSSPGISTVAGGGSSSTRSLPQITIDIPRRLESLSTTSRCLSLSRCTSMEEQGCSSHQHTLKSPSIRMSIKRLLSRERSRGRPRVSPSSIDNDNDREKDEEAMALTNAQPV